MPIASGPVFDVILRFVRDEAGVSVAEYALVTAIVIGIVAAAISGGLSFDVFGQVSARVADCADGACQ